MQDAERRTQNVGPLAPHANQPVLWKGPSPADARLAVILVHGRGSSADNILALADDVDVSDVAYVAPQAAGHTWYPYSFLAPLSQNEPGISSGVSVLAGLLQDLDRQGLPPDRVAIAGFSQGACLALEFAARHARRYAGMAGLSGGLIGPPGTPRAYAGSLEGTPVLLGCSDSDMGHTINEDEIRALRTLLTTGSTLDDAGRARSTRRR
jgi:predicted esterase